MSYKPLTVIYLDNNVIPLVIESYRDKYIPNGTTIILNKYPLSKHEITEALCIVNNFSKNKEVMETELSYNDAKLLTKIALLHNWTIPVNVVVDYGGKMSTASGYNVKLNPENCVTNPRWISSLPLDSFVRFKSCIENSMTRYDKHPENHNRDVEVCCKNVVYLPGVNKNNKCFVLFHN